jgi:hypothetical protein
MATMEPRPSPPWQFSLRALLAFTTAFAICAAITVHYARLGFMISFVVASAAAIYAADRLAGATPTAAVRRTWRWVLIIAWGIAGAFMLTLGTIALWLYDDAGPEQLAAWIIAGLFFTAAVYCVFRGGRSM